MTIAFLAIFVLLFVFGRLAAAVATIPATIEDVVLIVADAITLEFYDRTFWCLVFSVQTFASETVFVLVHVASLATAVTAVPVTGAVVIVVIAERVTTMIFRTAFARTVVFFVDRRVTARTKIARTITELANVVSIAAVSLVPQAF